jgi:hypothetical protein
MKAPGKRAVKVPQASDSAARMPGSRTTRPEYIPIGTARRSSGRDPHSRPVAAGILVLLSRFATVIAGAAFAPRQRARESAARTLDLAPAARKTTPKNKAAPPA